MNVNIKELLLRASMDYVGPMFPLWWAKNQRRYQLPDLRTVNRSQLLGAKYFLQVRLSHKGQVFELPNEPIISLGLTKTIVETATVGKQRKGTVKEYICTEDYNISIKGICIDLDDPEVYPAAQVATLNDMFEINEALEVESNLFFELFGIRKIVLKDIQFEEMIGEAGMQKYSITAISDQDFYADLNERDKQKNNLLA